MSLINIYQWVSKFFATKEELNTKFFATKEELNTNLNSRLSSKEDTSNKVLNIPSAEVYVNDDLRYPTVYAIKSYVDGKTQYNESTTNKVTSITSSSTNTQYPSALSVYSYVNSAIGNISSFDYEVVQSLPQSGVKGKIYLINNNGNTPNIFDEYIWIVVNNVGSFEKIGTTEVNLNNYYNKSEIDGLLEDTVDLTFEFDDDTSATYRFYGWEVD